MQSLTYQKDHESRKASLVKKEAELPVQARVGDRDDCQEPELDEPIADPVFPNAEDMKLPSHCKIIRPLPDSISLNCLRKKGMC